MKKYVLYSLVTGLLFYSCSKDRVPSPSFEVSTESLEYRVNDTVTFNFKGNPDIISFFPGTPGADYEYRNRTIKEDNKLRVQFTSLSQRDEGDLRILVSTDFSGKYDSASVRSATWADITNRAVLSKEVDRTPSGIIDLSEFSNTGKLVYFAFRYASNVIKSPNSRWVIRTINFENVDGDGNVLPLANMVTAGWQAVSFKNASANWSITSAQLLMDGGRTELDDDWVISKGFDVRTVEPDRPIGLKNIAIGITSYTYVYATPGQYKTVFIARNQYESQWKEVAKELMITIKP